MRHDLQLQLVRNYPSLFVGYFRPPMDSAMAFGFECGDGWFDLIDTLCSQLIILERRDEAAGEEPLRVLQEKEKHGTLRFYVGAASEEAHAMIEFAEALSGRICERCGNRGHTRGTGWKKTRCDSCALAEDVAKGSA